jgi:flagellar biogenesis protein FliO
MKKNTMPSISVNNHAPELPEFTDEAALRTLRPQTGLLSRFRKWLEARRHARFSDRRLRVAETVSLGEKRFVAVVQVDGRHFLLAGGPTNIVLLAQLHAEDDFEEVLQKTMKAPDSPQKGTARSVSGRRPNRTKAPQKIASTPGKTKAKRTAKRSPLPIVKASDTPAVPSNTTTAFGDLLNTVPVPAQLMKPGARQNGRYTSGNPEEYA